MNCPFIKIRDEVIRVACIRSVRRSDPNAIVVHWGDMDLEDALFAWESEEACDAVWRKILASLGVEHFP